MNFFKIIAVANLLLRIAVTAMLMFSIVFIVMYSDDPYCLIVDSSICCALFFLLWSR